MEIIKIRGHEVTIRYYDSGVCSYMEANWDRGSATAPDRERLLEVVEQAIYALDFFK